ncbi:MAG: SIMPL domain-containing protein [Hyphomicrobiaceae bacterium]
MKPITALAIAGVLALAPILGAAPMTPAEAQEKQAGRVVMVAGHGSVEAAPDAAQVTTGVVTEAATAREALTANSAAMRKVIDGLKAAGIAAKDIQTQQFQIHPRYRTYKDRDAQQIEAYVVRNQVAVKVREIARLGDILDQAVTLGANQASSISFIVSDAERRKDEARRKAIENATHRARLLAESAGARLGPVLTINEDVAGPALPRPMVARSMVAESVPIEAGSEMLTVRVVVSFALE